MRSQQRAHQAEHGRRVDGAEVRSHPAKPEHPTKPGPSIRIAGDKVHAHLVGILGAHCSERTDVAREGRAYIAGNRAGNPPRTISRRTVDRLEEPCLADG